MKKLISFLACVLTAVIVSATMPVIALADTVSPNNEIRMRIFCKGLYDNGKVVNFSDQRPFIDENGNIMIPFSEVMATYRLEVSYTHSQEERIITVCGDGNWIELKIPANTQYTNSYTHWFNKIEIPGTGGVYSCEHNDHKMVIPLKIMNNRTLISLTDLTNIMKECFHGSITYDKNTNTIDVIDEQGFQKPTFHLDNGIIRDAVDPSGKSYRFVCITYPDLNTLYEYHWTMDFSTREISDWHDKIQEDQKYQPFLRMNDIDDHNYYENYFQLEAGSNVTYQVYEKTVDGEIDLGQYTFTY